MKIKTIFPLIISMFISQILCSQSLLIKGFFKNSENESIQVDYILTANSLVVDSGDSRKIKTELELNKDYVLTVFKEGFVSKSIYFSTYTKDNEDFYFEFDLVLKEDTESKKNLTSVSTKVYYDTKLRAFNYVINKHQYSQH